MSKFTHEERAQLAKLLRGVVHTTPEFENEKDRYDRLLDDFIAFGYPVEADDQNALDELVAYATTP